MDALLYRYEEAFPQIDVGFDAEELWVLLEKEETADVANVPLLGARNDAVGWIIRVSRRHGFAGLTAVLAGNYLDRFLVRHPNLDKPWMVHLAATACLHLAAKVEETEAPLLIDLQLDESPVLFDAATIKKMETVILTALGWRMHPVTAISFFDCFIDGIGLDRHLSVEFLRRCESVVLTALADHRTARFPPSVLAPAAMVQVVRPQRESPVSEFELQLLSILPIEKSKYDDCRRLIKELCFEKKRHQLKRNFSVFSDGPLSPGGVIEISFSADASPDSSDADASVSSSPQSKKCKAWEG